MTALVLGCQPVVDLKLTSLKWKEITLEFLDEDSQLESEVMKPRRLMQAGSWIHDLSISIAQRTSRQPISAAECQCLYRIAQVCHMRVQRAPILREFRYL